MKKFRKLILLIIPLVLLGGCGKVEEKNENPVVTDAIKFKNEYESLNDTTNEKTGKVIRSISINENNPMVIKNEDDIVEMINNKETFVVYFGFANCPWCRSVVPTLIQAAEDLTVDKIYYVDVKDIRDVREINDKGKVVTTKEGSEGYYKLLELLEDVLSDYTLTNTKNKTVSAKEKRIYAPNIVAVINGKATKMVSGISEKQTDAYMELTEEMIDDTYREFKSALELMQTNNVCTSAGC